MDKEEWSNLPGEAILKMAVQIDDIDRLISPQQRGYQADGQAIVWLNLDERPDVEDVIKQHQQGKEGYAICHLGYLDGGKSKRWVVLRVEMRAPTRTAFHIAMKTSQYAEQLDCIATYGKMWLVKGPIPDNLTGSQAMNARQIYELFVQKIGVVMQLELQDHLRDELRQRLNDWR